jgi:hypothetical protein
LAVTVDPARRVFELRRPEPALARAADFGSDDEIHFLQDADVLLDAVERQVERLGELADRRRAAGEPFEDAPARDVCEGEERPVQGCR